MRRTVCGHGLEIILLNGEFRLHGVKCVPAEQIDSAVDKTGRAGLFFPERDNPAGGVADHFAIPVEVAHGFEGQGRRGSAAAVECEHRSEIDAEESVAVEDEYFVFLRFPEGEPDPSAGAEGFALDRTCDLFAEGLLRDPLLDGLVQMAEGKNDMVESVFKQIVEKPGQERPSRHGRHALGQVADYAPKARPHPSGENDALHHFFSPKMAFSTISQMIWPIVIWASWILGVSVEGTLMSRSDKGFIFPPSAPVMAMVFTPFSRHTSNAATMLDELPDVDIPTSMSPFRPRPDIRRAKIRS